MFRNCTALGLCVASLLLAGCARSVLPREDPGWVAEAVAARRGDGGAPVLRRAPQLVLVSESTSPEATSTTAGPAVREPEIPCWCENRFRLTTVRLWYFRSYVPDNSDPDTFGVEINSEWGMGPFHATNISYFEIADYPIAVPGQPVGNPFPGVGSALGMNDLLTAFLFAKKRPHGAHHGPHHFEAGFAAQLPTARDDTLGSGKWSIGPAVEYVYERGRFFAAFVALNVFSFAGDEDRKSVNMFMLKPMVTYELSSRWRAVYMPYGVSVYWNKKPGQKVYVPIGGGFQYDFRVGSLQAGVSLQYFYNVVRPTKGTQHDMRLMFELNF